MEIPEKKSIGINFKCTSCGEGLTIWAEGADLKPGLCLFSCPFCDTEKPLKKI